MKYYSLLSLLVFSLIIGGCSSEEFEQEQLNLDNNEITEILATTSGFCLDDFAGTRTTITMGSSSIENPVWAQNDTIGIYPTSGDQLSFPIVDGVGTSTCTFDGGGWALKTSSTYTAYSPFNRAYYSHKQNSALPISMLNQKQNGNDNTKHLGAYDIQIAKGQTPENGKISFAFEHKVCIVRMDLELPVAASWKSISLTSDASFTTEATMNLATDVPSINAKTYANSITLSLYNVNTTEENKTITAYMMLLPVDFTDKYLKVKVTDKNENTYVSSATIINDNRKFEAQKARWITANQFILQEKPDYSWYDSSKSTYIIEGTGQLIAFANIANGDATALTTIEATEAPTFEGKTINITKDLDLAAIDVWIPIEQFSGTFDGNNHTISNLYCNQSGDLGLFKEITNATIRNLTITGTIKQENEDTNRKIGGFVASADNSTFENCHSNVNITTDGEPISLSIGGICGRSYYSNFYACSSNGTINDYQGEREWTCNLGGIAGFCQKSNFIACYKLNGNVFENNISSYSFIGGIVGYIYAEDNTTAIWGCYSAVDVEGRQPGLILGSIGATKGSPNIKYSYYDGTGYGHGTIYGIGTKYYGGWEQSYDYGTARGLDIEGLNTGILEWNTANPSTPCNYKYQQGSNGLEVVPNK